VTPGRVRKSADPHSQRRASAVRKFIFWAFTGCEPHRLSGLLKRQLGGAPMRQIASIAASVLLVTCGGTPPAASSAAPAASPSTAVAAVATPRPTYAPGTVMSKPSGVSAAPIAKGRFDQIDAMTRKEADPASNTTFWEAQISTKGISDFEILQNTIAPGGTFGWHSHPGPSFVIVKSGTATFYLSGDPKCTPHVVEAGSGFVDRGGDVHVVRNEGTVDLVTIVASLIPAGATRRIDEASPGSCGFRD
jgi:quercetin dioxygenase-like cupin family protein